MLGYSRTLWAIFIHPSIIKPAWQLLLIITTSSSSFFFVTRFLLFCFFYIPLSFFSLAKRTILAATPWHRTILNNEKRERTRSHWLVIFCFVFVFHFLFFSSPSFFCFTLRIPMYSSPLFFLFFFSPSRHQWMDVREQLGRIWTVAAWVCRWFPIVYSISCDYFSYYYFVFFLLTLLC